MAVNAIRENANFTEDFITLYLVAGETLRQPAKLKGDYPEKW
jgi:hypothetical protein